MIKALNNWTIKVNRDRENVAIEIESGGKMKIIFLSRTQTEELIKSLQEKIQ